MVSTPLHRGRQDLVADGGRRNCRGVHSTPSREIGLGCKSILCDMRAAAAFRVDAIAEVSTPLHRGRQDWVVNSILCDMRAAAVFRVDAIVRVSTPLHRGRQD
ncbi:hypothetical protein GQ457_16G023260 [Hibiscus cannabinus]